MAKATIPSGQTKSAAIDLQGPSLTGLFIPAAFTGTVVTFETSPDGVTWYPVYNDDNTVYSVATATKGIYIVVNPAIFVGIRYIKVVSNAAEGGARIVNLVALPFA